MLTLPLKLPNFNAVAAGQVANLTLPKGPTYRQVLLNYRKAGVAATQAQMAADLTKIRFKINGIVRWEASAADWISTLLYLGFTIDAGVLPIFFAFPTARTPIMEEALAWGTADVDTLTCEVEIAAGAGAVTLDADTIVTPESRPLGPIMQVQTIFSAASAAGTFELSTLPRTNGDLAAIHFFTPQATKVEVQMDGVNFVTADYSTLKTMYKWTGRLPQANVIHFEPIWLDRYDDRIPLQNKQDVRFKLTMGAADTVRILMMTMLAPLGIPAAAAR